MNNIPKQDLDDLKYAKKLLETPGFATKVTNALQVPIEKGFDALPRKWSERVYKVSRVSLSRAMDVTLLTLADRPVPRSSDTAHKKAVILMGAAGGAMGLATLPVELPISTLLMLRSIADIARSEGERLRTPEGRLACLSVFALGGTSITDKAAESRYFAVRTLFARAVSEAAKYMAERGIAGGSAPALVKFITTIAARFSLVVSDKVIAQAIPLVGAAGGGLINKVFMDHFQDVARAHFMIRRLERTHGQEPIQDLYSRV